MALEGLHHITAITADAPGKTGLKVRAPGHVARSAAERLLDVVAGARTRPTPIIDRRSSHFFYFREPSGVPFELATRDIGFALDETVATLGEQLKLRARFESRRAQLERALKPIPNPREAA